MARQVNSTMSKRTSSVVDLPTPDAKSKKVFQLSSEDRALINRFTEKGLLPEVDETRFTIDEAHVDKVKRMNELLGLYESFRKNNFQFGDRTYEERTGPLEWDYQLNPYNIVTVKVPVTGERSGLKVKMVLREIYEKADKKAPFAEKDRSFSIKTPPLCVVKVPRDARIKCTAADYKADADKHYQFVRSIGVGYDSSLPPVPEEFLYGSDTEKTRPDGSRYLCRIRPKHFAYTMNLAAHTFFEGLKLMEERALRFVAADKEERDVEHFLEQMNDKHYRPFRTNIETGENILYVQFNAYEEYGTAELERLVGAISEEDKKAYSQLKARDMYIKILQKRNPNHISLEYNDMQDPEAQELTMRNYGYKPSYETVKALRGRTMVTKPRNADGSTPLEPYSIISFKMNSIFYGYTSGQCGAKIKLGDQRVLHLVHCPAPSAGSDFNTSVEPDDVQCEEEIIELPSTAEDASDAASSAGAGEDGENGSVEEELPATQMMMDDFDDDDDNF